MERSDRGDRPDDSTRLPGDGGSEQSGQPGSSPDTETGFSRRQLLLAAGAVTVGLLAVTETEFFDDEDDEHEIRLVLNLNGHTLETDDLEEHMETVHPDAPMYDEARQRASDITEHNVTVDVTVESIAVDNATAEAEVVRTTRAGADEDDYPDTREWLAYELRRYDGEWRIYDRTVRERETPPATDE